jgi:hypothetical protein
MRLCILLAFLAASVQAENALRNGDFENGLDGWTLWGAVPTSDAHSGKGACKVHLDAPAWAGASQEVAVPAGKTEVVVHGWLRSDSIQGGKENWERGRLSVEFFGPKGDTLGGYPPAVGQVRGRMGWTRMERRYPIPAGTSILKVGCALGNSTGTLLCDDFGAEFLP